MDDAYEYAFDQLRTAGAEQTPQRWLYGAEGDIFLARSPAGVPAPPLPEELRNALESRHLHIRLGAVAALGEWLADPTWALTAHRSLQQVADTDVPQVTAAARSLLDGPHSPESRPGASPIPAPVSMAGGQRPPESTAPATPRRSIRRRWLALGAAALAGLVVAALAVVLTRQPDAPVAANEFSETSPWRLVIKNNNHCRVTLRPRDSTEVWTTRYTSGSDQSWQMRQSGTFRWESTTPECVISPPTRSWRVHAPGRRGRRPGRHQRVPGIRDR